MPSHSKQAIDSQLRPYFPIFASIMIGAWADWMASGHVGVWCNRSRATFVWEQMIARAQVALALHPEVTILPRRESYIFLVKGAVAFRLKKSDARGLTSNYPTQAAIEFHDPQSQLPGLPEVARVDVVYVLNKLQTAVADVLVVAREKDEILWTLSALDADSNVVALPVAAPIPDAAPKKVQLVSVKSGMEKGAEKGGGGD